MMRITCPSCLTAYDVPDHLLAASSRPLRCSVCGNSWVRTSPKPAEAESVAPPAPQAEAAPSPAPLTPPETTEAPSATSVETTQRPKDLSAPPRPKMADAPSHAEWEGNDSSLPLIILVIIGVLLILLGAAVVERTVIMHLLPASTPLFHALGLA